LIELFHTTSDNGEQEALAIVIERLFTWNDPRHLDILYSAIQHSPVLAGRCRRLFEPVTLNSPGATYAREL
jgi:hypothetical protein